ncbi:MAG: hypothetical protein OEZ43_21620 [Gammaproteobacteria bacterium]|nr:hypothetical protein [Gammaproteobacteria bacterium]
MYISKPISSPPVRILPNPYNAQLLEQQNERWQKSLTHGTGTDTVTLSEAATNLSNLYRNPPDILTDSISVNPFHRVFLCLVGEADPLA